MLSWNKKQSFLIVMSQLIITQSTLAQSAKTNNTVCTNVLHTIFDCKTVRGNQILVCQEDGQTEYRFLKKNLKNTIVNIPSDALIRYPLQKNSEALGFKIADKEYKIFAYYKTNADANNIYDDNVVGGVKFIKNNQLTGTELCKQSPDSVNIHEVINASTAKADSLVYEGSIEQSISVEQLPGNIKDIQGLIEFIDE